MSTTPITDPITVSQAASILSVSEQRVRQLVAAGALVAVAFGSSWMISRKSAVARQKNPPKSGRPSGRTWCKSQ